MLLKNEFTVAADVDTVWAHLLDMEGVAACLPGARIEEVVPPNVYKGTIRVRIGPMTVEYRGQATLAEVDVASRSARIDLKAREARGQGSALATVRNHLEPAGSGTRVVAETDLQITGPQAQFGKGVLEDVGGRVLEEFSRRLEERMAGSTGAAQGRGGSTEPGGTDAGEALDLGKILTQSAASKAAKLGGIAALVVVVLVVLLRGRRAG